MTAANEPTFLAKLADLFRAEGDTATADALVARCESTTARSISDADRDRVLSLQRKGIRLDNMGAHEEAEGCFADALQLIEDALGPEHVDIINHLNDLARCRFNSGDYEAALKHYGRLARAAENAFGPDDIRAKIARYYVERCRKSLRDAIGAWRLQSQMDSMLQQARGIRLVDASNHQDRLRDAARRRGLSARDHLRATNSANREPSCRSPRPSALQARCHQAGTRPPAQPRLALPASRLNAGSIDRPRSVPAVRPAR